MSKTAASRMTPTDIAALSATGKQFERPVEKGSPLWVRVEATPDRKGKVRATYVCRTRLNGKSVRKTIGKVSEWTLTEAKRKARAIDDDARDNGGAEHFKDAAIVLRAQPDLCPDLVENLWDRYWKLEASLLASANEKLCHWQRTIGPTLGKKRLDQLTRKDFVEMIDADLDAANARGEVGMSNNTLLKTVKRFINWCVEQGYLDANPVEKVKKRVDVKKFRRPPRALSEQELTWLFKALARHSGRRADAVELLLRSCCRRANIFEAKWKQLGEQGLLFPRTKNDTPLMLPLTKTMRTVVGERPKDALDDTPIFVFNPRYLAELIPMLRADMTEIARADGFNGTFEGEFINEATRERNPAYWSAHDFRDSCVMWLKHQRDGEGMPKFAAEVRRAMLNHRSSTVEATSYNDDADDPFWSYHERKVAGAAWDAFLDRVKAAALDELKLAA